MTAANTDTPCPAARLAREAAEVIAGIARAEAVGDHAAADDLQDRREGIETAATFARASSALGALFQAMLLIGEADEQSVCFDDVPQGKKAARRMQRLAASIAGQLETSADAATVATLRSYYPGWESSGATVRAAILDRAA